MASMEESLAADAIARAEALVPELIARQGETEERGFYAEDIHAYLARSGLYRILVPRRYGGYELGIETFLQVCTVLTRGCASAGWMYCLSATHALAVATLFGDRAQAELFAAGDFICPGSITPTGLAVRADDGWLITGTWPYCSGAPYATHFLGHTLVATDDGTPAPLLFVAPRSQWRRLDDWGHQLGLRGSGSHSIVMENGWIPGYLALPGVHIGEVDVTPGTPGELLHGNPEYAGGQLSYLNMEPAALALGMARAALEVYEELLPRATLIPPGISRAEHPDYQFWYGEAAGMIGAAEAALRDTIRQWRDLAARGVFTREEDLRIAAVCRHIMRLCWDAVESHLFPTAGSSALLQGARLERIWRDMSMMRSHAGLSVLLPTVAVREFTRARAAAVAGQEAQV
jgi:3-hydroxy-9,10-secoandrosta-1,3,5(10)-triene-9,17-dione monooxygenase